MLRNRKEFEKKEFEINFLIESIKNDILRGKTQKSAKVITLNKFKDFMIKFGMFPLEANFMCETMEPENESETKKRNSLSKPSWNWINQKIDGLEEVPQLGLNSNSSLVEVMNSLSGTNNVVSFSFDSVTSRHKEFEAEIIQGFSDIGKKSYFLECWGKEGDSAKCQNESLIQKLIEFVKNEDFPVPGLMVQVPEENGKFQTIDLTGPLGCSFFPNRNIVPEEYLTVNVGYANMEETDVKELYPSIRPETFSSNRTCNTCNILPNKNGITNVKDRNISHPKIIKRVIDFGNGLKIILTYTGENTSKNSVDAQCNALKELKNKTKFNEGNTTPEGITYKASINNNGNIIVKMEDPMPTHDNYYTFIAEGFNLNKNEDFIFLQEIINNAKTDGDLGFLICFLNWNGIKYTPKNIVQGQNKNNYYSTNELFKILISMDEFSTFINWAFSSDGQANVQIYPGGGSSIRIGINPADLESPQVIYDEIMNNRQQIFESISGLFDDKSIYDEFKYRIDELLKRLNEDVKFKNNDIDSNSENQMDTDGTDEKENLSAITSSQETDDLFEFTKIDHAVGYILSNLLVILNYFDFTKESKKEWNYFLNPELYEESPIYFRNPDTDLYDKNNPNNYIFNIYEIHDIITNTLNNLSTQLDYYYNKYNGDNDTIKTKFSIIKGLLLNLIEVSKENPNEIESLLKYIVTNIYQVDDKTINHIVKSFNAVNNFNNIKSQGLISEPTLFSNPSKTYDKDDLNKMHTDDEDMVTEESPIRRILNDRGQKVMIKAGEFLDNKFPDFKNTNNNDQYKFDINDLKNIIRDAYIEIGKENAKETITRGERILCPYFLCHNESKELINNSVNSLRGLYNKGNDGFFSEITNVDSLNIQLKTDCNLLSKVNLSNSNYLVVSHNLIESFTDLGYNFYHSSKIAALIILLLFKQDDLRRTTRTSINDILKNILDHETKQLKKEGIKYVEESSFNQDTIASIETLKNIRASTNEEEIKKLLKKLIQHGRTPQGLCSVDLTIYDELENDHIDFDDNDSNNEEESIWSSYTDTTGVTTNWLNTNYDKLSKYMHDPHNINSKYLSLSSILNEISPDKQNDEKETLNIEPSNKPRTRSQSQMEELNQNKSYGNEYQIKTRKRSKLNGGLRRSRKKYK